MSNKKRNIAVLTLFVPAFICLFCFVCAGPALANTSTSLPWDSSLSTLSDSLTGPVAFALGLFMIVCGYCAFAFMNTELGGWIKWVATAAILAGMLGAAPTVLEVFGLQSTLLH